LSFGWRISSEAKNLLILALAAMAMTQGFTGDSGSMKFYQRILDYFLVTLYSALGVLVYDSVVERISIWRERYDR
jgi:hypothetical protein